MGGRRERRLHPRFPDTLIESYLRLRYIRSHDPLGSFCPLQVCSSTNQTIYGRSGDTYFVKNSSEHVVHPVAVADMWVRPMVLEELTRNVKRISRATADTKISTVVDTEGSEVLVNINIAVGGCTYTTTIPTSMFPNNELRPPIRWSILQCPSKTEGGACLQPCNDMSNDGAKGVLATLSALLGYPKISVQQETEYAIPSFTTHISFQGIQDDASIPDVIAENLTNIHVKCDAIIQGWGENADPAQAEAATSQVSRIQGGGPPWPGRGHTLHSFPVDQGVEDTRDPSRPGRAAHSTVSRATKVSPAM